MSTVTYPFQHGYFNLEVFLFLFIYVLKIFHQENESFLKIRASQLLVDKIMVFRLCTQEVFGSIPLDAVHVGQDIYLCLLRLIPYTYESV